MVYRWLLGERPAGCLGEALLVLLGNPDHFRRRLPDVMALLGELRPEGVFLVGKLEGRPLALTSPRLGGPAAATTVEVAAMAGVRRIVALGYTGGLRLETRVGSVFVARDALGLDGTSLAYQRGAAIPTANGTPPTPAVWAADGPLTTALEASLERSGFAWTAGRMATTDAIMLEDDAMVAALAEQGCGALDMETACLYAVARKLGLAATSLHLVSDNPFLGDTNPAAVHLASFPEALALAAHLALG